MTFQVKLTASAADMFARLHPETRKNIKTGLKGLNENPYLGKTLQNELALFRSLKLKRFRVVYRIDDANTREVVNIPLSVKFLNSLGILKF